MNTVRSAVMVGLIVSSFASAPTVQAACDGGSTNQLVGTVAGAVLGGILGSTVGKGDGKKLAIAGGAIAGGFLGNRFGASLDCKDQQYHQDTAQQTLENQPAGTTSSWRNPDSGHAGTVTPVRTYQNANGTYCRDFEQTVTADGRTETQNATACRDDASGWKVVEG